MNNEKNNAMAGQELVDGTSKKQNWKGLSIALVVILVVCLLILAAIELTRSRQKTSHNNLIPINENDIFNIKFPKPWNGTWISDRHFTFVDEHHSIWVYDCDKLKEELLFERDTIQQENIGNGIVSPSARYILIPRSKDQSHRFYTEYQYDIYEKTKKIASITSPDGRVISLAAVSYSRSDNYFAFVSNFNVFLYDVSKTTTIRVTSDGSREAVHNGLVEWNYEYEIFKQISLLFWSPKSQYLAYIKINLQYLPKSHHLSYESTSDNRDLYSIPYPKFGDKLPSIDVYIYSIKSGRNLLVPKPADSDNLKSYVYIFHVVWYCDKCFSVVYGNRAINSSLIQLYEIETTKNGSERIVFKSKFLEETRKGSLLTRFLKPFFSPTGAYGFIVRFDPLNFDKVSQKNYPHIVRIHFNQSHPQIDNTSPSHVHADQIIRVDQFNSVIFTGTTTDRPLERQVYRWNYNDGLNQAECLSCDKANETCGYAQAQFSVGQDNYYILECYGPSVPYSVLYNRTSRLAMIHDNSEFKKWAENRLMPYVDYFSVPLDKKDTGHGMIILPPNYNPNVTIASYPVIVSINDQLFEQQVTKKYPLLLADFVHVTQNNVSIVYFDSHGSTGQDEGYLKNNAPDWFERQFEDYNKLAHHLKLHEKKFNETLNSTRFGLKARGPAAVIALSLLEDHNANEYICAFLQAPVTDLSQYHSTYSERIQGLKENPKSSRRLNVQNKSVAIVHGTADEDVHFKHSASLAKSFLSAGSDFEFKVYPDVDHDFEKDRTVFYDLFHFQQRFFQECLGSRVNKERKLSLPEEYE